MRSLGDKISSTIVAQSAQVPTMAWSGTAIADTILSDQGFVTVADDVYRKACVDTVEEGLARAEQIGYPVMIKASEGGGGKGIRMVDRPDVFKNAFHAVAGEIPGEQLLWPYLESTNDSHRLPYFHYEACWPGPSLRGPVACGPVR